MFLEKPYIHKKNFSLHNIIKIIIISFVSFSLIGNFIPFYDGVDSLLYGNWAIRISEGSFGFTNEFIENAGPEFIPAAHVKTVHDTAIPIGGLGIYGISAFSYLLGGYYGLFYLGPIFTIFLIIFSERIATKLFGPLVGTITLVLIGTDQAILRYGEQLLTDSIFSLFFILGCFYLIKFLVEKKPSLILYCSIFFSISTIFRINGLVLFPIEILIPVVFFVYKIYQFSKNKNNEENNSGFNLILSSIKRKKFVTNTTYLLLPWILFMILFFSYNTYYFGDPLTTYRDISINETEQEYVSNFSLFSFDTKNIEWLKFYSVGLLPDLLIFNILDLVNIEYSDSIKQLWLSVFTLSILVLALGLSLLFKNRRKEILIFLSCIVAFLIFYSLDLVHPLCDELSNCPPTSAVRDRFMIPGQILTFMLVGFILNQFSQIIFRQKSFRESKKYFKTIYVIVISLIILFLIASVFFSDHYQKLIKSHYEIKNPIIYAERFPIDSEGLSENSMIMGQGRKFLEYPAIPFFPFPGVGEQLRYNKNPEILPKESIDLLKQIIYKETDVFVFKDSTSSIRWYLQHLEKNEGIIAKDYSPSFCKLELKNGNEKLSSDPICYQLEITIPIGKLVISP